MDKIIQIFDSIKKDNNLDFSIFHNKSLVFGSGKGEKTRLDIDNHYFEASFNNISSREISIYKYFISKSIINYLKYNIDDKPLKKLLLNKEIPKNDLKIIKNTMKSGTLILINSKNIDYNLNLLYEIYEKGILIEYHNENIVFYKNIIDDVDSEILSIYSAIVENSIEEPYIAYSNNNISYKDIYFTYKNLNKLISISKNYLKNTYILKEDNFRILYLLDNLSKESKLNILNSKKNKLILNNLDNELIITITSLVENNMNLQQTSESLFIHRNTLNYRLKKFEKDFNIDIKNVKNTIFIYILILLKRESDIKGY